MHLDLAKALELFQITQKNKDLAEKAVQKDVRQIKRNVSTSDRERLIKRAKVISGLHLHKTAFSKAEKALIEAYKQENQIEDKAIIAKVEDLGVSMH